MSQNDVDIPARTRPLQLAIEELIRTTETDFLRAGTSLAAAVDQFQTLEGAAGDIAGLSADVEGVAGAARSLDASLRAAMEQTGKGLAPLPVLSEIGAELDECVSVMSQRVRTMRVVSINARVVIATMDSSVSGLSRFADDVRDVGGEIEAVLVKLGAALADLRGGSSVVASGGERLRSILGERTTYALSELTGNLGRYERGLDHLTSSGGALARRGEGLRREVTAAVLALQAGDALRQRLEHCAAVLEAASEADAAADGDRLLHLARCHLDDLAAHHRAEVGKAADALEAAGGEARQFLGEIAGLVSTPDGPGTSLQAAVRSVGSLLKECGAATDALHAGATVMTDRMNDMLGFIAEFAALGERIRYIALNAVIACAGLGAEGDPLKAISSQLRELAEDSIERQRQMQVQINRLEAEWTTMHDGLAVASETLRVAVSDAAGRIERCLADLHAKLEVEGARIEAARRGLNENLETGSDALGRHVAAFGGAHALALRVTPAHVPVGRLGAAVSATSSRLRALLTIEQERRIHDGWHRTVTGSASPPPPTAAAASPALDDILFG